MSLAFLKLKFEEKDRHEVIAILEKLDSEDYKKTRTDWLHIACRSGWISVCTLLIEKFGHDPWSLEYDGIHGALPLHFACISGNIELVQYLISQYYSAPLNLCHVTDDGLTILHCAVMGGLAIVKCIVEEHRLKSLLSVDTPRIMLFAYNNWDDELMKYLIVDQGCSIVINHGTGYTLLHAVCEDGALNKVKFLVDECHCNPHAITKNEETILHLLFSSFYELKDFEPFFFSSPFSVVNPLALNSFGRTAVDYAIMSRSSITVLKCLLHHSKLMSTDRAHILSIAYHYWSDYMIKYLIVDQQFGIVTDLITGNTVLHNACRDMDISKLRFLLEECHLSPQSIVNYHKDTLLHAFSSSAWQPVNFQILSYLCDEHCCYPFERNASNHTPLECAIIHGHEHNAVSIVRYFVEYFKHETQVLFNACSSRIIPLLFTHWNDEIIKSLILKIGIDEIIIGRKSSDTMLQRLCKDNNLTRLKFLVQECKCDPSIINTNGKTILDILTPANEDIVYFLCNECELTPVEGVKAVKLIIEMQKESEETISMIRFMISKCGCKIINNVDIMNSACVNWNYDTVKFLIVEVGCNIIVDHDTGDTILHKVCITGTIEMLKFLVNECKCNPQHIVNMRGESLLHRACRYASDNPLLLFDLSNFLCVDCGCSLARDDISPAFKCAIQYEEGFSLVKHLVKNYRYSVMSTVFNIFSSMCWNQSIMRYLIAEEGFFVVNEYTGDTLLHKACETVNLANFYFLLQKCKCSPYVVNKKGESILHTICNSQFLISEHFDMLTYLCKQYPLICDALGIKSTTILNTLCTSLRPENTNACISCMQAFVNNCKCDTVNENWSAILLQLSSKFHFGPEVVKFVFDLIKDGECDPLTKDSFSSTILHSVLSTTKHYSPLILHFIYFLIKECGIDISSADIYGNTPLHLACQNFTGDVSVIEHILVTGKADPLFSNKDGETPLMVLDYSCRKLAADDRDRVFQLVSRFGEVKLTHPIHSFVNIVLLGDPGVGKSTLTKAIKDRNDVIFAVQFRNVKSVELLTAGIVPHIFNDDDLGNIIIHDLAGHVEYYSSHIAVLENLLQGSAAVFIIVISLADDNFLKSFHRWLAIVENISHNSLYQCQLILAVSHIDQHSKTKAANIESLRQEFSQCLKDSDILCGHGVFGLDCRKLGGSKLSILISSLSTACQCISEANTRETSLYCHMLYDYFQRNKQKAVYTLGDIVHKSEESNELFLPQDIHKLHRIVYTLSTTGLIVFLENQLSLKQSWIIADKSVLVRDLNGVLFAPKGFKQHANIASNTGVVKLCDLLSLFPQYDPKLLLRFLQYSELCQILSNDFMTFTNMKPLSKEVAEEANADTYLFVPALIRETGIPEIKEPFKFGWCLRCGNLKKHHFLTPRFLHLLLLHLAYKFSESSSNALEQLCQIWSKGIFWKGLNGAQTLIELIDNNQSLIVLVSFQNGRETSVARIINHIREVIVEILTCKQQVMPRTDTSEFILDNRNLLYPLGPLSDLTLFDIRLLAKCRVNGDSFILDTTGDRQVAVCKLFFATELSLVQSFCDTVFAGREPKCLASGDFNITVVKKTQPVFEEAGKLKATDQNCLVDADTVDKKTQHASKEAGIHELKATDQNFQNELIPQAIKKFAPRIMNVLPRPNKLANDLHGKDLLSTLSRDKVIEDNKSCRYEKSSSLINEVQRSFRSVYGSDSIQQHFVDFCSSLRDQSSPGLSTIVDQMMESACRQ